MSCVIRKKENDWPDPNVSRTAARRGDELAAVRGETASRTFWRRAGCCANLIARLPDAEPSIGNPGVTKQLNDIAIDNGGRK
jgi:hypothetical protein